MCSRVGALGQVMQAMLAEQHLNFSVGTAAQGAAMMCYEQTEDPLTSSLLYILEKEYHATVDKAQTDLFLLKLRAFHVKFCLLNSFST